MVDETHTGFGVIKDTTARTRSTTSGVRLAKRMGRPCLLARGCRGLKLTQGQVIAPLTHPSPYLTARPTSTFHSRVLCSDLQVMMSVSKEAIFEVKFQSC